MTWIRGFFVVGIASGLIIFLTVLFPTQRQLLGVTPEHSRAMRLH